MAKLYADAADWGDVVKSSIEDDFPCYDSNYTVRKLTFTIDKSFATYQAMIAFEKTTIKTYFTDREYNLIYAGETFTGYILQQYRRSEKINANNSAVWCSYEVVFIRDGA